MTKKFDDDFDSAFDGGGKFTYAPRCYESHKPLTLGKGLVYGGSCSYPMIKTCDVYVGLDGWMKFQKPRYPWHKTSSMGPIEIPFTITDMQAPSDPEEFKNMIAWLAEQLAAGKSVHVGCMGGHGRTGTVLAALVKVVTGEVDAITWVRTHYCKKAVESKAQVNFLHKYFGITKVPGSKGNSGHGVYAGTGTRGAQTDKFKSRFTQFNLIEFDKRMAEAKFVNDDDLIPGTKILRARGPRDPAPAKSKVLASVTPTKSGNGIW